MTGKQIRRAVTLGRIDGFAQLHPEDFPAGEKAAGLLEIIRQAATDLTAAGTSQLSSGGDARAGSKTKADLYDGLNENLQAINRTARSLAHEIPGLDAKFRMPRSAGYGAVLTAARAFLTAATPLKAEFVEYELPADFLTDLADDIAAFDAAEEDQGDGLTGRAGATESIGEAIRTGSEAARRLDPILRNKYRDHPARLAEWFTASHTEREARKARPVTPGAPASSPAL